MRLTTSKFVLIYALLVLPCVFSSALIFPIQLAPWKLPLYLVCLIFGFALFYKVPQQIKLVVCGLIFLLFFATILSFFWVSSNQFGINFRGWILNSTLFMCGIVGAIVAKLVASSSRNFVGQLLILFSILFLYGTYTYYAQEYDLVEFLYFLRPSPALTGEETYSQAYAGWATKSRAYSVWYEPSFSALVLACSLPLLYFNAKSWVKIFFVLTLIPFVYLTFARSTWLIGAFFVLGHFSGLFNLKLSQIKLLIMAITIALVLVAIQVFASTSHEEISALIRITSIVQGFLEWLDHPLLGTGQTELVHPIAWLNDATFIHATMPQWLHWYGLMGLLIVLIPFWFIAGGKSEANASFVYLSIIAITVGGAIMMMSIFWFFWGFYMIQKNGVR